MSRQPRAVPVHPMAEGNIHPRTAVTIPAAAAHPTAAAHIAIRAVEIAMAVTNKMKRLSLLPALGLMMGLVCNSAAGQDRTTAARYLPIYLTERGSLVTCGIRIIAITAMNTRMNNSSPINEAVEIALTFGLQGGGFYISPRRYDARTEKEIDGPRISAGWVKIGDFRIIGDPNPAAKFASANITLANMPFALQYGAAIRHVLDGSEILLGIQNVNKRADSTYRIVQSPSDETVRDVGKCIDDLQGELDVISASRRTPGNLTSPPFEGSKSVVPDQKKGAYDDLMKGPPRK